MVTTTGDMSGTLPREMQQHTYPLMYAIEGSHWWFIGRRKIIESVVERVFTTGPSGTPRILDIGCGTGANLEMLGRYGDAEGVDISTEALGFCRDRGLRAVQQGAAEDLPFENEKFDLVTALDVLEHLDDDIAGLREMRRVLKPGGRAFVFVPAWQFLWGVQDDVSHHRRRYTLPELRRAMCAAGFNIETATYANFTFFVPILLGRLLMRITGLRPESENRINIPALNGVFGRILGAESVLLRYCNVPIGVSALCVGRRSEVPETISNSSE